MEPEEKLDPDPVDESALWAELDADPEYQQAISDAQESALDHMEATGYGPTP